MADQKDNEVSFIPQNRFLLFLGNAYPKLLIARIWRPEYQHEGIRIIDAADWLKQITPQILNMLFLGE